MCQSSGNTFSYPVLMDLVPLLNFSGTCCLYFGNKINFYVNIYISCLSNEARAVPYLFLYPESLTYSKKQQILITLNLKPIAVAASNLYGVESQVL